MTIALGATAQTLYIRPSKEWVFHLHLNKVCEYFLYLCTAQHRTGQTMVAEDFHVLLRQAFISIDFHTLGDQIECRGARSSATKVVSPEVSPNDRVIILVVR